MASEHIGSRPRQGQYVTNLAMGLGRGLAEHVRAGLTAVIVPAFFWPYRQRCFV